MLEFKYPLRSFKG